MSTEAINNNSNILIDPTFANVNRLFVSAYQTAEDRKSFFEFYLKILTLLLTNQYFFNLPINTEEEAHEKIKDISKNNEYTTGNLLD